MPARGGVLCDEVLRCDNVKCTKWRYKEAADAKGETACLCGRPFTRTELRRQTGAKAKPAAKAKAQAKPKAKAKAKAQAQAANTGAGPHRRKAPWARGQETGSATGGRSTAYELTPESAARAAKDDVAMAEEKLRWCRTVGREDYVREAERELQKAQEERDRALPPRARLSRLKEQREEAEKERVERENAVAVTEEEIYNLERRLHDERAAIADVISRLETLDYVIEQVELQIPPEQGADTEATPQRLTQQLMQVQQTLLQLQGGYLPAEVNATVMGCLTLLDNQGAALDRDRREREAQVASDARLAKALAEKEAQERANEEEDVDATGEGDSTEVSSRGRAKKGKGLGKGWTREAPGSPTRQQSGRGPDIGPLATLGRVPPIPPPPPPVSGPESRAASEPRGRGLERRRSPRRQQAGTPAQPGADAAGVLGAPPPTVATGSPTEAPSAAAGPPAAPPTAAAAAASPPGAGAPAGMGQPGTGAGGSGDLNPGGRPMYT